MNIKKIKGAIKIGKFILKHHHQNKIDVKYNPKINKKILKDKSPRVYLFVKDGIIIKMGGSADNGGIKSTIGEYAVAMTGSPSGSRFIPHLLIEKALKKGSKIEIYMISSPKVSAVVKGLFGSRRMKIASYKEMERLCFDEYYSKERKYPAWNFKENHQDYPKKEAILFHKYHQNRIKNKKK